jgi:hypothetical protein
MLKDWPGLSLVCACSALSSETRYYTTFGILSTEYPERVEMRPLSGSCANGVDGTP